MSLETERVMELLADRLTKPLVTSDGDQINEDGDPYNLTDAVMFVAEALRENTQMLERVYERLHIIASNMDR